LTLTAAARWGRYRTAAHIVHQCVVRMEQTNSRPGFPMLPQVVVTSRGQVIEDDDRVSLGNENVDEVRARAPGD
jgi:hypothetical protein